MGSFIGLVPFGNKPLPEPCWPKSMSPYATTWPQWVNHAKFHLENIYLNSVSFLSTEMLQEVENIAIG